MGGKFFNDKYEELRFRQHLIRHDYDKILVLWGEEALVQLQNWYQESGYGEGVEEINACMDKHSHEYEF